VGQVDSTVERNAAQLKKKAQQQEELRHSRKNCLF
jgi:hypothetical protein